MNELDIKHKTELGSGVDHSVFPFHKFDDKVIKTKIGSIKINKDGKTYSILDKNDKLNKDEMFIFQHHPDLFAKVYKLTDRYAIIEKLNTKDIQQDLYKLSEDFIRFMYHNPKIRTIFGWVKEPEEMEPDDINLLADLYVNRRSKGLLKAFASYVRDKEFYIKLITFLNKCYNELKMPGRGIDIHDGNVGYDKNKNIKLLDF